MLTPQQLEQYTDRACELFDPLVDSLATSVARRLASTDLEITGTVEWQIEVARVLGLTAQDINDAVQRLLPQISAKVAPVFVEAMQSSHDTDAGLYEHAGRSVAALNSSPVLQQLIRDGYRRTMGTLENLTRTRAVGGNSMLAESTQLELRQVLDLAHLQVSTGAFSYTRAIQMAVNRMANDGIAAITYPSGHTDKVEVVIRRAMLTGINQTAVSLSLADAEEAGQDLMELTAHQGARPSHAVWQGKIVSLSGREGYLSLDDIGYGTVTGFQGANCRHNWFPFIEGVSERNWSDAQLDQLNRAVVTYNGQDLPYYDATQMQRAKERRIRKYKRQYLMQREVAATATDVETRQGAEAGMHTAAMKLQAARRDLADFLDQTGLTKQQDRESVPGFSPAVAREAAAKV